MSINKKYPASVQAGIPKLKPLKEGWQRVKIGTLFDVQSRPVNMEDNNEYRLVTVKRSRGGVEEREKRLGNTISVKSQFYLQEGDFLISKRQISHGACGFVNKELEGSIVSNEYSVLTCKENVIIPDFLKYLSYTPYFQQTCFHSSIGVHVEKLIFKLNDWFKWKIDIPILPEQQKIASFLSSVDRKISLLQEKHSKLQQYKKGVMQQLFSQKLRFTQADGSAYPDWEEKKLGCVFERVTTKNTENNSNVLTISAQLGLINQEEYFTRSVSSKDVTGYYLIKRNEFAYNKSYSNGYPFGAIKKLNRYDKGVVSTLYICFKAKNEKENDFYEQYFEAGCLNHEISKIAQEGARNHGLLNLSVIEFFKDISLVRPCIEEQQKIAECLMAIDAKIDAVADQLASVQVFKKGLLQKMFV